MSSNKSYYHLIGPFLVFLTVLLINIGLGNNWPLSIGTALGFFVVTWLFTYITYKATQGR